MGTVPGYAKKVRWTLAVGPAEGAEEFADAAGHLERAVSAEPQNASWHFLLGQAYQRLGDAVAAAREFSEARRLKEQEVLRARKGIRSYE